MNIDMYGDVVMVTVCQMFYDKEQIASIKNISKLQVKRFHEKFGHPISNKPTAGHVDLRALRVKLILEEALEFAEACGFEPNFSYPSEGGVNIDLVVTGEPNLVEMADALGDLDYVVQGANIAFGIPSEEVFAEIHASNMSKLGPDGNPIYREDGKVLKGPNYFKPNIAKIIGNVE